MFPLRECRDDLGIIIGSATLEKTTYQDKQHKPPEAFQINFNDA